MQAIASHIEHKTVIQCYHRWCKVLNPEVVKGNWRPEEDGKIVELVATHGAQVPASPSPVSHLIRCAVSCGTMG